MQEKTIYRVSVIITILGLIFLFFYAEEVKLGKIDTIENLPAQEKVVMQGIVTKLTNIDNAIFIEIEGSRVEKTSVIVFNDQELFLKEGDRVEISGLVEDYNGKKEIIASKVTLK